MFPRLRIAARAAALAAALVSSAAPLAAQGVRVMLSPLTPFVDASVRTPKDADSSAVALYAMVYLGAPGNVQGIGLGQRHGYTFAGINFLFSASAIPVANGKDYDVVGNLQRLHAHVTFTPLDSARKPLSTSGALEVLATLPDTTVLAPPVTDSSSSRAGTSVFDALSQSLVSTFDAGAEAGARAAPALVSFLRLYHRPSAQWQVGYVSGPRDFGWVWYGRDHDIIEGTHHTSAAVEAGPTTRLVKVHIVLTGEWKNHGAWKRELDVELNLAGMPTS